MKKFLLIIIAILGLSCASNAHSNKSFTDMNVNQFAKFISEDGVQLLDVRTPEEYNEGHLNNAININVFDDDFLDQASKNLDKNKPVAVYCRSGKRSADAAEKLASKGYKVTNLLGGIMAWTKDGQPIVK